LLEWKPTGSNLTQLEFPSAQNTEILSGSSSVVVGQNTTDERYAV